MARRLANNLRLIVRSYSRLPTFLVVGAPRSGTTSLHYYLAQHPQICMSAIKEPNFFLFDGDGTPLVADRRILRKSVPSFEHYRRLFRARDDDAAVGEVSPLYRYTRETPGMIRRQLPSARLVCVLRDPVDRAWSHFLHSVDGTGGASVDLFRRLTGEEMAGGHAYEPYDGRTHLLRLGLYGEQLTRYREAFGDDRLCILLYDDLASRSDSVLRTLAGFVGVDDSFTFDIRRRYNATGVPRSPLSGRLHRVARRLQPQVKSSLPPAVTGRLGRARAASAARGLRPSVLDDDRLRSRLRDWFAEDTELLATIGPAPAWAAR